MDGIMNIFYRIATAIYTFGTFGKSALYGLCIVGILFILGAVFVKRLEIKNKPFTHRQFAKTICLFGTIIISLGVCYLFKIILKVDYRFVDVLLLSGVMGASLLLAYFIIDRLIISLIVLVLCIIKPKKHIKKRKKIKNKINKVKKANKTEINNEDKINTIAMNYTRAWLTKNNVESINRYNMLLNNKVDYVKGLSIELKTISKDCDIIAEKYFNKFITQWK